MTPTIVNTPNDQPSTKGRNPRFGAALDTAFRAALNTVFGSALIAMGLTMLCGCEFFITPPEQAPDPATDGILSCGELMSVDGLEPSTSIPVDVPEGSGVEVLVELVAPGQLARLRTESPTRLTRALPVWDPVLERMVITGFAGTDETLWLELIGADLNGFSGSISLECTHPGEVCFNLSDDDGDGLTDCADIHCAREPRCADDQDDLDERVLSCNDQAQQLEPPILRNFDDQRTLYMRPDDDLPQFWGGAELMLAATLDTGTIELTFGEAGMVCVGGSPEQTVPCDAVFDVSSGETRSFLTAELPLRIEPLGPTWIDLRARLACD